MMRGPEGMPSGRSANKVVWILISVLILSTLIGMINNNQHFESNLELVDNENESLSGSNSASIMVNVPQAHHYYRGGTWAYIGASGLTVGENYEITWKLSTASGRLIDNDVHQWTQNSGTTYNGLSTSGISFIDPPLPLDDYCMIGELYQTNRGTLLDSDTFCFTISYSGYLYIDVESQHGGDDLYYGDSIDVVIGGYQLVSNVTYFVDYTISRDDGYVISSGLTNNWTNIDPPAIAWYDNESLVTLNRLGVGSYCVNAELFASDRTSIDLQSWCFSINPPVMPTGNLSIDSAPNFGSYTYTVGDIIEINMIADNLSEKDYHVDWRLIFENQVEVMKGSEVIEYWNSPYWTEDVWLIDNQNVQRFEQSTDFDAGNYCIEGNLTLSETEEVVDSAISCFEIVAVGDVTIELEQGENVIVGRCNDFPEISEQDDCESQGGLWQEWEWGWLEKTEYVVGENINWNINIENLSFTDYELSWKVYNGVNDIIAFDSFVFTMDDFWGPIEVTNDDLQCGLISPMDWNCWYWSDFLVGGGEFWGPGNYCFEVILTLANGGDFSSTDQVCHEVYATGDIYIELTQETEMMVGGCPNAPWASNQWECETMFGAEWVEEFEMGMGTQTQYEIGELVNWDIKIQNASHTDYVLSWNLTDENGLSLANDSFNWSPYNSNVMSDFDYWGEVYVFEVDSIHCQWLNGPDENGCWYWAEDYNVNFSNSGKYCFEVTLTLESGDEFSSSDEVCHHVLTEDGELIEFDDNSDLWSDSDNDGVIDELDECPDTEADEFTNNIGCSISQTGEEESENTPGFTFVTVFAALLSAIVILTSRKT